jgi:hypothetical protein
VSNWVENWAAVESAIKTSETKGECTAKVSRALGKPMTWDAIQRAHSRHTGKSIFSILGSGLV